MPQNIPNNALVVVADGGKAILFRKTGAGHEVRLREERRLAPGDFANDGPSGSRPEEQTPRQTAEATFAKELVQHLDSMRNQGAFAALVLAADPQTLGQVRDAMSKSLQDCIVFTLAKDLTNHAIPDIEDALG